MAEPLLEIDALEVTFRVPDFTGRARRLVRAVRGVSLRLEAGEVLGIVGESGSGKSTVARAVVGLAPPTAGTIRIRGAALPPRCGAAARHGVQMVFQDHASTLNPFQSVRRILDDVMRISMPRRGSAERRARAEALLRRVGLGPEALARRASSFSGGQRQRISIARGLAADPELLICDEPTSALDVSIQAQILELLAELKADSLALIFISHNLAVVRQIADRIAVMYAGIVVEEGAARDLIAAPAHPYTAALVAAAPVLTERGALLARTRSLPTAAAVPVQAEGCPYRPRCPRADEACGSMPPLAVLGDGRLVRCHHPVHAGGAARLAIAGSGG